MPTSANEGLFRIGAQYGEVQRDGRTLAEVTEISATVEVNRIEIPLVGSTKMGYKPGRESREGSFTVQKIDSSWEMEVFEFLSQNLEQRRAQRATGEGSLRPFSLIIHLDDPDALGYETWQLDGCLLWRLSLGFSITDDIINREYPFTWEREQPIATFKRVGGVTDSGVPQVSQVSPTN